MTAGLVIFVTAILFLICSVWSLCCTRPAKRESD